MVRQLVPIVALLLGVSASMVNAHPLHTSFTEIGRDARTGTVTLSVRLFSDDFKTAMDSVTALPSSRGVAREAVVRGYFERSIRLVMPDGKEVALAWCGIKTVDGLTWLCASSVNPVPPGTLRIRNALMFDRFADQISIVRWTSATGKRTIVLTTRSPEADLE